MIRIPFTKAQGAGNDFLILRHQIGDTQITEALPQDWVRQICDRRMGIGADGVVIVTVPSGIEGTDAIARIINSDGSEAEISGNGTRCAAAFLVYEGLCGSSMLVRTGAGDKRLNLMYQQENRFIFEMSMGNPVLNPSAIPFLPPMAVSEPVIGFALPVGNSKQVATITSMGNPHCSIRVEHFAWDWQNLGRQIEHHPYFPNRTNIEFYRVISPHEIEVRFWERGAGETQSSGTGSCAAVVAAILNKQLVSPVKVQTLAGNLQVQWESNGIFLTGPAEIVCQGEYFLSSANQP